MIRTVYIKWFFLIFILWCSSIVNAQNPVKKAFAYSRDIIPGRVKVKMKPDGKPIRGTPVVKTTWYFFLQGNIDTAKVKIRAVWIKKKKHPVNKQQLVNTPFTLFLTGNTNEPFELVPATTDKVLQIFPAQLSVQKNSSRTLNRLLLSNQLVIEIYSRGKLYYSSLEKIMVLSPLEEL